MHHSHQAKRPYNGSQPSITSYFSAASAADLASHYASNHIDGRAASSISNTPQLPHAVQSSLINVGMRVRKSVPEGYKTASYSAFTLFSDPTTPLSTMASSPNTSTTNPLPISAFSARPRTRPRAGVRELTPFCGLLKVGGLATQQTGIYASGTTSHTNTWDPYGASSGSEDDEDAVPALSQGSTNSCFSVGAEDPDVSPSSASHKRRFFDEEESGTEEFVGMGGSPTGIGGRRVLAVPRRRRGGAGASGGAFGGGMVFGKAVVPMGQENRVRGPTSAGVQVAGQDVDFEDAEFLDYEGLTMGREVEMSG